MGIRHARHASTQDNPARDDNEQQDHDLDNSNHVHSTDTPVRQESVQQGHRNDDGNGNAAFLPFGGGAVGSDDDVRGEDDASGSCLC